MSNEIVSADQSAIIESVVIGGDLSKLSPEQRVDYYKAVCESLGLNPLTKPFDYITLNGKLTLYPKRDATDQLRRNNGVSITKLERENISGVYVVTAYAQDKEGRTDSSTGAVFIETLKGDALANALMKAETKAKRRVTLSICGLGMLDETEIETIPTAKVVTVTDTGELPGEVTGEVAFTMDLETAKAVKTSEGVTYGSMDTKILSAITKSINDALKKNSLTPERREELLYKLDAAKTVLASLK